MAKVNPRLEIARSSYRDALAAARENPTPEAWARLLAAGKELSAAEAPPRSRRGHKPGARPASESPESPPPSDVERIE